MKSKPRIINLALMFVVLFGALGFFPKPVEAAIGTLQPGDVAVILMNTDNPDSIAFVALADLPGSETIIFTDSGWYAAGGFRSTEGAVSYTVPSGGLPAGTIVYRDDPFTADGWGVPTGLGFSATFLLSSSGDQVIVFQGDTTTHSLIYAVNGEGAAVWQADATSSNTSALPTGLIDGLTAVAVSEQDNIRLNCAENHSGSKAELLSYISNSANWVGNSSTRQSIDPSCSFTVTGGEPPEPKINEFVADHINYPDTYEFVEIYGEPETDYSDYTILHIEGDSGSNEGTIDSVLSVGTTDPSGFWWTGYMTDELENGTITLLLVKDFTGSDGDDLDTDDDGVLNTTPWSEITDSVATSDGGSSDITYGAPDLPPNYDGNTFQPGGASRIPDGYDTETDTDWIRNGYYPLGEPDLGEAFNTPGAPNAVQGCSGPYTPIYDIQGSGPITPIPSGTDVVTEGIVVGDFQVGGKDGFFIQDATGDGNLATSDGVFVYDPGGPDVTVGDHVRLQGEPSEYNTSTQIGWIDWLEVCAVGEPLPAPGVLSLPVASVDDYEAFEGMRVTFPQDLVIAEYFNYDRYGSIVLTSQRYTQFTAFSEPDVTGYAASMDEYALNSITLDDGRTNQNPDPAIHPNGLEFDLYNLFRGGDLVTNLTGVVDYNSWDELYVIQPTEGADYTPANPRTPAPDIIEGDIKVASLNVYNYFTTLDEGSDICGPVVFFDVIGKIGEDPGTKWGTEPNTTQDHTLIRQGSVCSGDTNSGDPFDPAAEWDAYDQDTFGYLGSHTSSCVYDDLIISEYIEGSSSNKALEIYNGTGAPVDLQNYEVVLYFNGSDEWGRILTWGTETLIPDGGVYVIANASADASILAVADITSEVTYFNGDDVVALKKAGTGGMECRGADDAEELERQRAKIISALVAIDADIVGLMEIENDRPGPDPDYAVADLVAGLNDITGPGTYDYIATGAIGTDAIKAALIYKPGNVTPIGDFAVLDSSVDPNFLDTKNRPVLAQTFMDNIVGDAVTVAVNHLKSKGSACDALGDPDMDDGQGNCNLTRTSAALAEVKWLAGDPTGTGVENHLIIGDLNSYDKEDPIDAIKAGADEVLYTGDDYLDMIYEVLGEDAYSYLFDGKIGYLDYAMANAALAEYVADVAVWHINADEVDLINYDTSYKQDAQDAIFAPDAYRASDHDPVIITLTFNKPPLAEDDYYEMKQDDTLIVPADGVLVNDSDLNENDVITLDVVVDPLHGTVVLNQDGSFTYIPAPLYFGEDSFEYLMMANPPERGEFSDTATVYITIDSKYKYYFPVGYGD